MKHITPTRLAVATALLLGLGLVACSGPTDTTGSSAGVPAGQGAAPAVPVAHTIAVQDIIAGKATACDILSNAEYSAVIGEVLNTPKPQEYTTEDGKVVQDTTTCEYQSQAFTMGFALNTTPYPEAHKSSYRFPVTDVASPCPEDADSHFGTGGTGNVGIYCAKNGISYFLMIQDQAGPVQIQGVADLMRKYLDRTS